MQGHRWSLDPSVPTEHSFIVSGGVHSMNCPVEAIMSEDKVPETWQGFIKINYMHSGRGSNDGPAEEKAGTKQDIADAAKAVHDALVED